MSKYKTNTVLHTKDGRKIGNAIIVSDKGLYYTIKTDYGTVKKFTEGELDELFYVAYDDFTEEELALMSEVRGAHKNYVYYE